MHNNTETNIESKPEFKQIGQYSLTLQSCPINHNNRQTDPHRSNLTVNQSSGKMLNPAAPSFVPSSLESSPLRRGPCYVNMTTNPRLTQKKGWYPLIHSMFIAQEKEDLGRVHDPPYGEPGEIFWFTNWTAKNPVHSLGQLSREAPAGPGRHLMVWMDQNEALASILDRFKVSIPKGYRAFLALTSRPRGPAMLLGEARPESADSRVLGYEKTSSLYQYVPGPVLTAKQDPWWTVFKLEHNTFVSLHIYLISTEEIEPLRSGRRTKLDEQSYKDVCAQMLIESVKPRFRSETIYPS